MLHAPWTPAAPALQPVQLVLSAVGHNPPAHTSGAQSVMDDGAAVIGCQPAGQVKTWYTQSPIDAAPALSVPLPGGQAVHAEV
jgi:hypothetical protein